MIQIQAERYVKTQLWNNFAVQHQIADECVPLFDVKNGQVTIMQYGRNDRIVLKRSAEMDALMRSLGDRMIQEFRDSRVVHDGILYMMLKCDAESVVPLYIGKAEIYGKGDKNLFANISDLVNGTDKFGRWGYNYAYHIGDLSAVTLAGHPENKKSAKYEAWRDGLFVLEDGSVRPKFDIMFWACLWGPDSQSIWYDYGKTKLAFEEYLLIGVASDVFPAALLNREGRNR